MEKGRYLSLMLSLATEKHAGQFDKAGMPYILHPLKVMHYLKTDDEELQCIALGHDLLEDTSVTSYDLAVKFTNRISYGILALTKTPGESYEDYQAKVMGNVDAMKVKLCDLRHNSDIRRLKGVTEKDLKRVEKYQRFYLKIQAALLAP